MRGWHRCKTRLKQLDPRLKLTVITDQARYIRDSVSEVLRTALYGGALAILVLFLFLRSWKTTLIIGIAIPISVVATFFLMYVSGISLNIMSLGGLTLGIGLLVDNSIVVLEAIQRGATRGWTTSRPRASGRARSGRAVVASTLTTICVFVPIVFVEGIAGQLFGDQALTVTYSLIVSLIVALTVIPMLASRGSPAPGGGPRSRARGEPRLSARAAGSAALGLVARCGPGVVKPCVARSDDRAAHLLAAAAPCSTPVRPAGRGLLAQLGWVLAPPGDHGVRGFRSCCSRRA